MAAPDRSTLSVWEFVMRDRKQLVQEQLDDVSRSVDYAKLTAYASGLRSGIPCRLADQLTAGGSNIIRLLEFDDGEKWIARILAREADECKRRNLQSAVDTMRFLREHSLPVPEIYASVLTNDVIGRPFTLMQFLPGNALIDIIEVQEQHPQVFSLESEHKLPHNFLRSLANFQVRLTAIRLEQIGRLLKAEGGFQYLPCDTMTQAHHSLRAMLDDCTRYRTQVSPRILASYIHNQPEVSRVYRAMHNFPQSIARIATQFSYNDRPLDGFPLVHTDLDVQNIIVDDELNLVGVIDWDVAWTQPWEFVDVPGCVSGPLYETLSIDAHLIDDGFRLCWAERDEMEAAYISFVKEIETELNLDQRLSSALENRKNRALHDVIKQFRAGNGLGIRKMLALFGIKDGDGSSDASRTCAAEINTQY